MSDVRVSRLDVQRAQLLVRLGQALQRPTSKWVRQIADSKPAATHEDVFPGDPG